MIRKNSSAFILVCFLFSLCVRAQDYQLFHSDKMYLYEFSFAGASHIVLFQSDSVNISGTDSILHNYSRSNDDQFYGTPANGFSDYSDTSWSGYKYVVSQNGVNILMNRRADSVIFHCLALPGDSWTFCTMQNGDRFIATVNSVSFDSLFSTQDSIKTFTIQRFDSSGTLIQDQFNNFEFKLSKSFGLLKGTNFKHFPDRLIHYDLKGIEGVVGEQRITPLSMYDYEVGDEFHYSSYNHVSLSVNVWQLEKRVIVAKNITQFNINYTVNDSVYTLTDDGFGTQTVTLYGITNLNENHLVNLYSYDSLFSRLPHQKNMVSRNYLSTWHRDLNMSKSIYTVTCVGRYNPYIPGYLHRGLGVCNGGYCSFPGGENWFVDGIGLVSHFASYDSSSASMYTCFKNLEFYLKGGIPHGSPISFPVITNVKDNLSENLIKMFPNPASTELTIENVGLECTIRLFDMQMKEVNTDFKFNGGNLTLNCQALNNGYYILEMGCHGENQYRKVIVSH